MTHNPPPDEQQFAAALAAIFEQHSAPIHIEVNPFTLFTLIGMLQFVARAPVTAEVRHTAQGIAQSLRNALVAHTGSQELADLINKGFDSRYDVPQQTPQPPQ